MLVHLRSLYFFSSTIYWMGEERLKIFLHTTKLPLSEVPMYDVVSKIQR